VCHIHCSRRKRPAASSRRSAGGRSSGRRTAVRSSVEVHLELGRRLRLVIFLDLGLLAAFEAGRLLAALNDLRGLDPLVDDQFAIDDQFLDPKHTLVTFDLKFALFPHGELVLSDVGQFVREIQGKLAVGGMLNPT